MYYSYLITITFFDRTVKIARDRGGDYRGHSYDRDSMTNSSLDRLLGFVKTCDLIDIYPFHFQKDVVTSHPVKV